MSLRSISEKINNGKNLTEEEVEFATSKIVNFSAKVFDKIQYDEGVDIPICADFIRKSTDYDFEDGNDYFVALKYVTDESIQKDVEDNFRKKLGKDKNKLLEKFIKSAKVNIYLSTKKKLIDVLPKDDDEKFDLLVEWLMDLYKDYGILHFEISNYLSGETGFIDESNFFHKLWKKMK